VNARLIIAGARALGFRSPRIADPGLAALAAYSDRLARRLVLFGLGGMAYGTIKLVAASFP
jgi:hypothetical protein